MRRARFHLERRKDKNNAAIITNVPIRMSFHFNGYRLEYYTQISVSKAADFIISKGIIDPRVLDSKRKNDILRKLAKSAEHFYDSAIDLDIEPTPQYIRQKLDQKYKGKTGLERNLLVKDAFEEFLIEQKETRSYRTWQKHNTTLSHLNRIFPKIFSKLIFTDVDSSLVDKFRKGLTNSGYVNKGNRVDYLKNSLVKYLRSFRAFINWCKDEDRMYYSGRLNFKDLSEKDIDVIYLSKLEMDKFIAAKMPTEALERVQDVFIFGFYTGMRYYDIWNLRKNDVKNQTANFYISKGTTTVMHRVPLVDEATAILNKYKDIPTDKALPVLANSKMNLQIKVAMKAAGINENITLKKIKADGSYQVKDCEKWEVIICHTSRKSFINHAVRVGMPEMLIKSLIGHSKNSRAFTKYYEISEQQKREVMLKAFGTDKGNILHAV